MGQLIDEIAAASEEQAQGIDQINRAVSEMDKVTQQTAASAEESASASEELTAQAEQMRGYVGDLAAAIGGNGGRGPQHPWRSGRRRRSTADAEKAGSRRQDRPPADRCRTTRRNAGRKPTPEQVIPLDDGGFKDF